MKTKRISMAVLIAIFVSGMVISVSAQQATATQGAKPDPKSQSTPPTMTAKQAPQMDMKAQKPAVNALKSVMAGKDIMQTLEEMPNFKMFVAAIKNAGLSDSYKGQGPFTVFAPNDDAFSKLPKDKLDAMMKNKSELMYLVHNHTIHTKYMAAAIKDMKSARSMHSTELRFMPMGDNALMVEDANVVKADIACSNGVIHEIDKVLMPPTPAEMEKAVTAKSPAAPAEKK